MLRRIVFSALLAGLAAGVLVTAVQRLRVIPLILEAETYETAAKKPLGRAPAPEARGGEDGRRLLLTALSNALAGTGFGLLLVAGYALRGGVDWKGGVLWGLGGFAAFHLAPALGLPPEPPGAFAAPLGARQAWWLATAAMTAAGLALLAWKRGGPWKVLGACLLALPHLAGAPSSPGRGGLAPESLARAFAAAALWTSALFWVALGGLSAFFFRRIEGA